METEAIVTIAGLLLGGAELRYAMHRLEKKMKDTIHPMLRDHAARIEALEGARRPPHIGADPFGDTPAGVSSVRRINRLGLFLAFVGFLSFGCTDADITRAQQLSDAADVKLAAATQAVDSARKLAESTNDQRAVAAVNAADAALAVAKEASDAGHKAVASAKASQEAGATTFNVLLAGAAALIPAAGGILAAVNAAVKSAQALRQTVAGIDNAKKSLPPESVALLHSELSKAQDESTKAKVNAAQAANGA